MKLFDTAMDVVSQGGVRRGAFCRIPRYRPWRYRKNFKHQRNW